MNAPALAWFEDDDPRDLARWLIAAALVVGIHAVLISGYLFWHQPDEDVGDDSSVVSVELTVPEIDQQEQAKVDAPTPPKETTDDAVLPEEKPPEKVEMTNPAPRTTVRTDSGAPRIDPSWQTILIKHIQRFKNYPSGARARNEQGVVLLAFSLDADGHVLERHIVKSSGHPDLDAEVLAMIMRAQPLPAFPPSMTETRLDLTVPFLFNLQ
jgi:protein TonB